MPYRFTPKDKSVTRAIRRIARDRFAASAGLIETGRLTQAELVHELRKNVKKVRALLRLVRPAFRDHAAENAALAEAGRMLTALRDAEVLGQTFDRVAARVYIPPEALAALRAQAVPPDPGPDDPATLLRAHAEAIAKIDRRARDWKIAGDGFGALGPGIERGWTAAQKAMRGARSNPGPEALHLWRRRMKDHWYHARLLQPIWPEAMAHHMAAAETLGELLGDARDLARLAAALADLPGGAEIRIAAEHEEARLLADAGALGRRFLSEPAAGLGRRWRGWWEIWRDG
ncbi:CHAD domain-containing protein [Albidovulum sp.]|uniref:CHAD domain-containing protein n=1 Tax=Albidovulum sp. TaxID=1872424 RepID=UPI0039B85DC1